MSATTHRDRNVTLTRIVLAFILVCVLNAGMCLATAITMQYRFNEARVQEQQQGQVIFKNLCTTLDSLYADKPPIVTTINNPSSVYLQDLHQRLGELATDIKC
jgi:hypothetical protein